MVTGFAYDSLDKAAPLFATDRIKVHTSGPDGGPQVSSSCVMTAPDGEQPTFSEVDPNMLQSQTLLGPQTVQLLVDHSFEDPAKRSTYTACLPASTAHTQLVADPASITDHPFVGIGVPHPWLKDEMIPVCVWEAEPGTAYVLQAGNSWRCFSGDLVPGQCGELKEFLDRSSKKGSNILVDFDTQSSPCELDFKMDGTFELAN
jgi:hypothetical protein